MFKEVVKLEIDQRSISKTELSNMSKVSRQQIGNWLKGHKSMSEPNLIKILESLNLMIVKVY